MTRSATLAAVLLLGGVNALGLVACGSEPQAAPDAGPGGGADADLDAEGSPGSDATADDSSLPNGDGGGGFVFDATTSDAPEACVPATACPPGVQCGRYVDPCSGQVFVCGSACASGQVCASTGGSPPAQTCQPKTCAGKCGVIGVDSCGLPIGCGGCVAGQACVGNQCVAQGTVSNDGGPSDACAPLSCQPSAGLELCGTVRDQCGNALQCSCPTGQQCNAGVCSTTPPECNADGGAPRCGSISNACGSGTVACGGCTGSAKCVAGTCTACTAPTCGGAVCGSVNNGCGPAVTCGNCSTGEVCEDGGCCTPMTCADALDAGLVTGCGSVNLGCGVSKSCQTCPTGEVCTSGACHACTPKTCADFGDTGCGHSDGCGKTLNCCGAGTTCQGNICCAPGEVNYNGTCCLPGCDLDQPPGPQNSCGQVILCNGGGMSGSSSGSSSGGNPQ